MTHMARIKNVYHLKYVLQFINLLTSSMMCRMACAQVIYPNVKLEMKLIVILVAIQKS